MARDVRRKQGKHAGRDRVRDAVLKIWQELDLNDPHAAFASELLAAAFKREPTLGVRARAAIAERLYGMIHQARRVSYALETASPESGVRTPDSGLATYVACQLLENQIGASEAAKILPRFDWRRVADADERIARNESPLARLALRRSLPDWLAQRLLDEYGVEADALAAGLNQRAPMAVRVNVLNATREEALAALHREGITAAPTPFARNGLLFDTRVNIFTLKAFEEGLLEPQDEASQLVAELAAPAPGMLVIDACAGAGGKTLALGALMQNKGRLLALDISARRLAELRRRARRAGLSNLRALEVAADAWPPEIEDLKGMAQRVLVDAPCTGTGALRRKPEARWRLCEGDVERLQRVQEKIARRAMPLCAPGGRLIYATCSLLQDENERVVERLLCDGGFQPVPLKEILGRARAAALSDASGLFLKMAPHRHNTDGFFAAVLKRQAVTADARG